jgi:hypothetical protein
MESDDEFTKFVMNEVIDLSSSDDESDLGFGDVHMIIKDQLIIEVELVLFRDMMLWIMKDYYTMVFFTKTISQIICSKQRVLDGGLYFFHNCY